MLSLKIKVNTAKLERFVDRVISGLDPMQSSVMRDGLNGAADAYRQAMETRYEGASQGDGTWVPLAPSTIRQRTARGDPQPLKTLIVTGTLEASVADRNAPFAVQEITPEGIAVASEDPIAIFQHKGTGRIPARPILVDPDADTCQKMAEPLVQSLKTIVRDAAS